MTSEMDDTLNIEFEYSQFLVYDRAAPLPREWTEAHSRQGFVRTPSAVAFGTLREFGEAIVNVRLGTWVRRPQAERVIAVPFYAPTGEIVVDGPTGIGRTQIRVTPGHYRVVAAQTALADEMDPGPQQEIGLFFEQVDTPVSRSEILVADAELDPSYPLVEEDAAS